MLQEKLPMHDHFEFRQWEASQKPMIDPFKLLAAARRQWRLVAASMILFLGLGLLYLMIAVPKYTASTDILIDQDNSKILYQHSALNGMVADEGWTTSQVELIYSNKIKLAVVDALKLADNPDFIDGPGGPMSYVRGFFGFFTGLFGSDEKTAAEREELRLQAAENLQKNMYVQRVKRTYVLNVQFTWSDPALAAQITRAFADAYIADQVDAKYNANRKSGTWMQDRLNELRQKALETDQAVQKFRGEHGLISANGLLVSEQQLAEINSQLILARAERATAEAKEKRIRAILDSGDKNAAVMESMSSSVIGEIRKKYIDASKRETEIVRDYGADHFKAKELQKDMEEYQDLAFQELGRIAESYRSDYQVAKSREESLTASVTAATGVSADANSTLVQLRELEREANTYRDLYQTFLTRYQDTLQQQTFPVTEARVITQASVPTQPSRPKKPIVLALASALGIALGLALATLQEYLDRFFRTGEQVGDELELEFLGSVPLVASKALEQTNGETVPVAPDLRNFVVNHPMSLFAETLRSAKIAADLALGRDKSKIIGITSVLPGEGKSTVAVNFARLLANQKRRVLLIDADLRNPALTTTLARHAEVGLVQAVVDKAPWPDLLLYEEASGLAMLPAVVRSRVPHTSELLASPEMRSLLREAAEKFDYIILDLPPLSPLVDARAIAPYVDGFLCVVEWGHTPRGTVRNKLRAEPAVYKKCLGVVLNKADMNKMKLYRTDGANDSDPRYTAYFQDGVPARKPPFRAAAIRAAIQQQSKRLGVKLH
jgi:succinoglycan biosynthesis transport protein ExoP